jgi:hypothetical protein
MCRVERPRACVQFAGGDPSELLAGRLAAQRPGGRPYTFGTSGELVNSNLLLIAGVIAATTRYTPFSDAVQPGRGP